MSFNFLKGLVLVDTGRLRAPKTTNPDGLTIRIFNNGEVYPSKDLVKKCGLEYPNKGEAGVTVDPNFGFDVVDSLEWAPMAQFPRVILLALVPKDQPKVDLFATVKYTPNGSPKRSVLTQGATSKTLLELVRSMGYLTDDQKYCDLTVLIDNPIKVNNNIAYLPKVIERGPRANEKANERRENVVLYPAITPEALEAAATVTQEAVGTEVLTSNPQN